MATTTSAAQKDAPLLGVSTDPDRIVKFRLMSYGPRDRETLKSRETVHAFAARGEVDAASALGTLHATAEARAGLMIRFLQRNLLDDDGVPVDEVPQPVQSDDPDDEEPGTDLATTSAELVQAAPELVGPDTEWTLDGQTFPSHSLAMAHARENGSSLRRFADLMDDPKERVKLSALEEIMKYLAKEGAGRPTGRSAPSPRRQTRKRR